MALRHKTFLTDYRGHIRTVEPAAEPVLAEELRTFLKESFDVLQDTEAEFYIQQAREYLEELTGLAFITQTWQLALDKWPGYIEPWWDGVRELPVTELTAGRPRSLTLPRYPLQSISSVTTYDEAGTSATPSVATYFDIDTVSRPGRLSLKFGQQWPLATRPTNAITINYVAGFGDDLGDVPAVIRGAVLHMAGYLYQHRGECDMREAAAKSGATDLVGMFKTGRF